MIAIVSDTHMPKGRRELPSACVELLSRAEATIHAGDLSAASVLVQLESLCPAVHAVHGNVDEEELRRRLPERLSLDLGGGHTVAVVHDAGPARGRLPRLRAAFPEAEAVVFGHSHLPLHEQADDFQIFNPGSPTERRRAPRASMGLLHRRGRRLELEHVWL